MSVLRTEYRAALSELEERILTIGRRVQAQIPAAVNSLRTADAGRAERIVAVDDDVDGRVHDVEDEIYRMLALQAPVAAELRLVVALLDVTRSVERIGDYCVNIAKLAGEIGTGVDGDDDLMAQLGELGLRAERAVRTALDAFGQRDTRGVERVEEVEDPLDKQYAGLIERLMNFGGQGPAESNWSVRLVLAARHLERVGDHAVRIAEQGMFVATGTRRAPRARRA
ncbi:phosphate signaling complex protein PhoU [soil metagenome]